MAMDVHRLLFPLPVLAAVAAAMELDLDFTVEDGQVKTAVIGRAVTDLFGEAVDLDDEQVEGVTSRLLELAAPLITDLLAGAALDPEQPAEVGDLSIGSDGAALLLGIALP